MEPVASFNWIDALTVIVFIRIFYISAQKGFVIELFKIVGTFISLFFARHFSLKFSGFISSSIRFLPEEFKQILFFLFVFFFFYVLFRYMRVGFTLLFKIEPHHIIERWFSLLIGIARGLLILGVVFYIMASMNIQYLNKSLDKSLSCSFIKRVFPFSYNLGLSIYGAFGAGLDNQGQSQEQKE